MMHLACSTVLSSAHPKETDSVMHLACSTVLSSAHPEEIDSGRSSAHPKETDSALQMARYWASTNRSAGQLVHLSYSPTSACCSPTAMHSAPTMAPQKLTKLERLMASSSVVQIYFHLASTTRLAGQMVLLSFLSGSACCSPTAMHSALSKVHSKVEK